MQRTLLVFLTVSLAFLLAFGNPVFVSNSFSKSPFHPSDRHYQTINLNMTGEIWNIARQHWSMSGGRVLTAYILGHQIDLGSGKLSYRMSSNIVGNNISGTGAFTFSATVSGVPVRVVSNGSLYVNNMNGGLCFPLPANVSQDCDNPQYLQPSYLNNKSSSGYTSAIPFVFQGPTNFNITMSGESLTTNGGFSIESASDNLFGGPVILASADQYVVIIANYTRASAQFYGMKFVGVVEGKVGNSPVVGSFAETSTITENFNTGLQEQQGRLIFNTTDSALNQKLGVEAITTSSYTHYISPLPLQPLLNGSYAHTADCSWATGIEGTCMLAQLVSFGYAATTNNKIQAVFVSIWTIPSAGFETQFEGVLS